MMVVALILLTALFAATEFSIVKVRASRMDQLIAEGNKKAERVKKVIDNLDAYLSACQLGITITALGLGWLGGSVVERLLQPVFSGLGITGTAAVFLSFLIAFIIIAYLHVVFGELSPKIIAAQKAEAIILTLVRPLIFFYKIMYPFIWLLNGSARILVRLFGFQPIKRGETAHSEEEVRMILTDSYENGEINLAEMTYLNKIFEFDDRIVREIMVPRNEMVYFKKDDSLSENLKYAQESQFTRYPVVAEDKDNITGLINLKEILLSQLDGKEHITIDSLIRPVIHVTETTPINKLLVKMQKERIHMAIVVDEYGGTAGIVTVEDILEQIVGEIRDEFDEDELPMVEEVDDDTKVVSGKLQLVELSELLGIHFDNEETDTIGGWFFSKKIDAKVGSIIDYAGHQFIIDEMDRYQIKKVRIIKHQYQEANSV